MKHMRYIPCCIKSNDTAENIHVYKRNFKYYPASRKVSYRDALYLSPKNAKDIAERDKCLYRTFVLNYDELCKVREILQQNASTENENEPYFYNYQVRDAIENIIKEREIQ